MVFQERGFNGLGLGNARQRDMVSEFPAGHGDPVYPNTISARKQIVQRISGISFMNNTT